MNSTYKSHYVKKMNQRRWIDCGLGAIVWSLFYFLLYFYLRSAAYHVRYPKEAEFAAFKFMDDHLLLWWILGLIIEMLFISYLIHRKMVNSLDVTLDFMKMIWKDPDKEIPIPLKQEEIYHLLNFFQDQLHNTTKAIKQEQQRKSDLIVYLAHDLKTPLTSVQGYLNLILDQPELPQELQKNYISIAVQKAERLEEQIYEFFDIARFNLSDISIHSTQVNFERLIEQEVFEFQPALQEKHLTIETKVPENFTCYCDSDKMQRVLDNLLRNAVNYSYPDTCIHIEAYEDENTYHVMIENQGDTIPVALLNRLFEEFFRLSSSRDSKNGGSGIGLAIAKKIIEAHGGEIVAESRDNWIRFQYKWEKRELLH